MASRRDHLTLELTETAALAGSGEGLEMIGRLRDLGINIAIDDYGTGLSTLEYLKKIPANEIKIDQSFVKGIVDNRSDRLMVQSTIGLAHSLGRKVVAEGVEHRDILDLLIEMECDIAQGFAIGRPMSLEALDQAHCVRPQAHRRLNPPQLTAPRTLSRLSTRTALRAREIMVNHLLTISIKVNIPVICRIAVGTTGTTK